MFESLHNHERHTRLEQQRALLNMTGKGSKHCFQGGQSPASDAWGQLQAPKFIEEPLHPHFKLLWLIRVSCCRDNCDMDAVPHECDDVLNHSIVCVDVVPISVKGPISIKSDELQSVSNSMHLSQ